MDESGVAVCSCRRVSASPLSGADHTAIVFGHNNGGVAGTGLRRVRPVAVRVLDVNEHGFHVRCAYNASYFTTLRANEETLDFACLRVSGQHHVVEVRISIRAIGLDPQAAIVVKPETIRTVENIIVAQGDDSFTIDNGFRSLLTGKDEDIPVKAGSRVIVTFFSPANDVAGGIGSCLLYTSPSPRDRG